MLCEDLPANHANPRESKKRALLKRSESRRLLNRRSFGFIFAFIRVFRGLNVWPAASPLRVILGCLVKSLFQKEIHAIEIDDGTTNVQRVHPQNATDSGGALAQSEMR